MGEHIGLRQPMHDISNVNLGRTTENKRKGPVTSHPSASGKAEKKAAHALVSEEVTVSSINCNQQGQTRLLRNREVSIGSHRSTTPRSAVGGPVVTHQEDTRGQKGDLCGAKRSKRVEPSRDSNPPPLSANGPILGPNTIGLPVDAGPEVEMLDHHLGRPPNITAHTHVDLTPSPIWESPILGLSEIEQRLAMPSEQVEQHVDVVHVTMDSPVHRS